MKLKIYDNQHYEEGEEALYDEENDVIIMSGDYYHTKVSVKIEGYIQALNDHNLYPLTYDEIEIESIDRNHKYYKKFDFYDPEEL